MFLSIGIYVQFIGHSLRAICTSYLLYSTAKALSTLPYRSVLIIAFVSLYHFYCCIFSFLSSVSLYSSSNQPTSQLEFINCSSSFFFLLSLIPSLQWPCHTPTRLPSPLVRSLLIIFSRDLCVCECPDDHDFCFLLVVPLPASFQ